MLLTRRAIISKWINSQNQSIFQFRCLKGFCREYWDERANYERIKSSTSHYIPKNTQNIRELHSLNDETREQHENILIKAKYRMKLTSTIHPNLLTSYFPLLKKYPKVYHGNEYHIFADHILTTETNIPFNSKRVAKLTINPCFYPLIHKKKVRSPNVLIIRNPSTSRNSSEYNDIFKQYAFHHVVQKEDGDYCYVSQESFYKFLLSTPIVQGKQYLFVEPLYEPSINLHKYPDAINIQNAENPFKLFLNISVNSSISSTCLMKFFDSIECQSVLISNDGLFVLTFPSYDLVKRVLFLNGSYLESERLNIAWCPFKQSMEFYAMEKSSKSIITEPTTDKTFPPE